MSFRILSVDGGGIRGVMPAIWLARLQELIDEPLHEKFDLVCGTSTGSIIASSVALDQDIGETLDLYEQFGPTIFPPEILEKNKWLKAIDSVFDGPPYPDIPLKSTLQKVFGISTKLSMAKTKLLIPSYDVFNRNIFTMKSYDKRFSEMAVWEACKASSSAPTYFPAHVLDHENTSFPLIDGGVFANNPTLLGISEAVSILKKDSVSEVERENQIIVVSLGTGNMLRKIRVDEAKKWPPIRWARPIIDVLFDSSSELAHYCARQILRPDNYVRLQVDLHGVSDDMDDASSKNVQELKSIAKAYVYNGEGQYKLDAVKRLLS